MKLFLKSLTLSVILVFSFTLTIPHPISAQEIPEDTVVYLRVPEFRQIVKKNDSAVNTWWWGWLAGYSAATIGQGIAGIASDKLSNRQDMFLGAATTLIGAVGQFVTPVQPRSMRKLNSFSRGSGTDYSQTNDYLEYLKLMALAESKGRGWQMHVASGAVNLGSGLITWLGFKRTLKDGLFNFALNTAITEAQIWSQPVRAKKVYSGYIRQGIADENQRLPWMSECIISISSSATGIRLTLLF